MRVTLIPLLLIAALYPVVATPDTAAFGRGVSGYDWMLGKWSCINGQSVSSIGAPKRTTLTVSKSHGTMTFEDSSDTADIVAYNVYDFRTKAWASSFIASDGSYGREVFRKSGTIVVWTSSYFDQTSGKEVLACDTYTFARNAFKDVGEMNGGLGWRVEYRLTCSRL